MNEQGGQHAWGGRRLVDGAGGSGGVGGGGAFGRQNKDRWI